MSNKRTTAIRECLLDVISKNEEAHLTYLQERANKRKSVPGDVNFTDTLAELAHLERKGLISYIGNSVHRITEKGLVHAGRANGGSK